MKLMILVLAVFLSACSTRFGIGGAVSDPMLPLPEVGAGIDVSAGANTGGVTADVNTKVETGLSKQ